MQITVYFAHYILAFHVKIFGNLFIYRRSCKYDMEPINKKSGSFYRSEKERKKKLEDDVVRKTTKLECYFNKKPTNVETTLSLHVEQTNELNQSTEIENNPENVNITTQEDKCENQNGNIISLLRV